MSRSLIWTRGTRTINLTDPAGGWREQRGATGLDMPPFEVPGELLVGVDGELRRRRVVGARDVTVPMMVQADTEAQFRAKFAEMLAAFGPGEPGRLRAVDGTVDRFLECSFTGGLAGDEAHEVDGGSWWRGVLQFRAHDPYWRDSSQTAVWFRPSATVSFFPMRVNGSGFKLNANATFGSYVTTQAGDAPSWPTVRVYGPFSGFEISTDDGLSWALSRDVPAGEYVQVDFDPLAVRLLGVSSGSAWTAGLYDAIVWPSQTWPVTRSGQKISVAVTGSDSSTQAVIWWANRWLSWRSA